MANGNTVTFVGNLTRDPELRFTQSGQARAVLGIAVNRRWQNRSSGEWEEQVSFFNVVCWGEMAENVSESLSRGSRALVTGRLEQRSWDTPEGDKRSVVEISAEEIGPSLRWATAEVRKTERTGGGQGFQGQGTQGVQGGGGRPQQNPAPVGASDTQYYPEEEPF
jgi:single-strand DNA-binding protein